MTTDNKNETEISKMSIVKGQMSVVRKAKGFTLVELLIAITVIAIISSIGYINFTSAQNNARDGRRKSDLKAVSTALVTYYQDFSFYPPPCNPSPCTSSASYASDAGDNWIPGLTPTYIQKLPKDPRQAATYLWLALKDFFSELFHLPSPAFAAPTTIPVEFDGYARLTESTNTFSCFDTSTLSLFAGRTTSSRYRTYLRFPLTSLPANATITNVTLQITVTSLIGSPTLDIQGYGGGRTNPQPQSCSIRYLNSKTGSPYVTWGPISGTNDIWLPQEAIADIANAKNTVGFYSLAINEGETATGSNYARFEPIESSGTNEAKLVIDYVTATPTPTPSPTPTPGGTPTPSPYSTPYSTPYVTPYTTPYATPPVVTGCAGKQDVYCYIVDAARTYFILWAQLDRANDPEAYNQPNATCKATPPAVNFNYCLESPQ